MPRPQVSGCEPVSGLYILRGGPDMSGPYSVAAKASGSMRASTSMRRGGFHIRPERLRWPQGPAAARGLAALHMTREGLLACAASRTPPLQQRCSQPFTASCRVLRTAPAPAISALKYALILSARTVLVRSLPKMDALDRMPSSWSVTVSGLPNSMRRAWPAARPSAGQH